MLHCITEKQYYCERRFGTIVVRQLTERHTITLPMRVLKHVGAKPGDLLEINDDGRQIILRPKVCEDLFSDEEWEKLGKLSKRHGKVYKTAKEAKEHLRRLYKLSQLHLFNNSFT